MSYKINQIENNLSRENEAKSMLENIKPAAGRVVVLPDAPEEKTTSGLYIPDTAKPAPTSGRVTHVGADVPYNVGDHVLYVKNAGVELKTEPVHFLMRTEDIYASI